jgi:hypothetical protein
MRGRVIAGVALTLGLLTTVVAIQAQVPLLDSLLGRDLSKSPSTETEKSGVTQLIGKVPLWQQPWHVWKTSRNGQERYVLLMRQSVFSIPGSSYGAIQLFDRSGSRVRSWSFKIGSQMYADQATFEFSEDLNCNLITFQTKSIKGRNIAREYFALKYDQLRLIRLEDDKGQAVQNEYLYPNNDIGLVPDAYSTFQWISMLESTDKSEVLSALTFLGGRFTDESMPRSPDLAKETKYTGLFEDLMENSQVRELISALTKSDHPWIRQAAVFAARAPRDRPPLLAPCKQETQGDKLVFDCRAR